MRTPRSLNRSLPLFITAFAALMLVSACNEDEQNGAASLMGNAGLPMAALPGEAEQSASDAEGVKPSDMTLDRSKFANRKIAETHAMTIETEPDELRGRLKRDFRQCLDLGCEITGSNVARDSGGSLQARIDPEQLGAYLNFLATGDGEVKSHQVSAEDKTYQYVSTTEGIKNQEALRDRLRALLNDSRAKTIPEILEVERELARVQTQIDTQTTQKKIIERTTNKATVMVNYTVPYQAVEMRYESLSHSLRTAWRGLIQNIGEVIMFFGQIIPWLPVIFLFYWLMVRMHRIVTRKTGDIAPRKAKSKAGQSTDSPPPSPLA